jgi:hypothetical protein
VAALILEAVAVTWTGSFLIERLSQGDHDLRSRIAHWRNGLTLLYEPSDWAFGIGLGRLPANYARFVEGLEFSGALRLADESAGRHGVTLLGPAAQRTLAGQFSLLQRVPLREHSAYRVELDYRVHAITPIYVGLCEQHLLYERRCQSASAELRPGTASWQHLSIPLAGAQLDVGDWFAPRLAFFAISVLDAGATIDIARVELRSSEGAQLIRNGDFSRDLAHWFPAAQDYFVPWHIDNLYLEWLIERGAFSLLAFVALTAWTLRSLLREPCRYAALAPFLAASLCGVLLLGLVSSVLDAPRPAFLLFFLTSFAVLLCRRRLAIEMNTLPNRTSTTTSQVIGWLSTSLVNLLISLTRLNSAARKLARAAGRSAAGPE